MHLKIQDRIQQGTTKYTLTSSIKNIFFSPGERRLRAGWRILVLGLLTSLGILLISPFYLVTAVVEINPAWNLLFLTLLTGLPIIVSVLITRKWIDKRSVRSLGLKPPVWRDLFNGLWIAALMISLIFLVEWALGWIQVNGISKITPTPSLGDSLLFYLLIAFLSFVMVGFYEELLVRGYLLVNLQDGLNQAMAVLLSSIAFAVMHSFNPEVNWKGIVGLAVSGVFLAYCAIWSKKLWLPVGIHIGWNFFLGAVYGLPVSGIETGSLVSVSETGPDIFTGGSFGPEAGLLLLPGLAMGFLLVYSIYKPKRQVPQ